MATSLKPLATLFCTGVAKTHNSKPKLERNAHFCTDWRHFLCTGAAFLNFLHRRGVFVKSCKTIVPVHKNRSSTKLTKTDENLIILGRNRRTPRTVWRFFFNSRARFGHRRLSGTSCGRFSDASRTPPGLDSTPSAPSVGWRRLPPLAAAAPYVGCRRLPPLAVSAPSVGCRRLPPWAASAPSVGCRQLPPLAVSCEMPMPSPHS